MWTFPEYDTPHERGFYDIMNRIVASRTAGSAGPPSSIWGY